jgi:Family of unknown function (DUF6364)
MSKEKLTLYVDQKTSRMAHRVASTLGKSISELVREYMLRIFRQIEAGEISPSVSRWIGAIKSKKTYKSLRDEMISDRVRRYENPG